VKFIKNQTVGSKLVLQWSNRDIPKDIYTTFFLVSFTLFWICFTGVLTVLFFKSIFIVDWDTLLPMLAVTLMLAFAFFGLYGLLTAWTVRFSVERIEICAKQFLHGFSSPWVFSRSGPISQVSVQFLLAPNETTPTINLFVKGRRDIIAHGASVKILEQLFDMIQRHAQENQLSLEIEDLR